MNTRRPLFALIGCGLALGLLAALWIGYPPNPVNPWYASVLTVGPAERWWYGLPEATRTLAQYNWAVGAAALVYPIMIASAFIAWCWPLRTGKGLFPRRSLVLAGIIGVLSLAWYLMGWGYGMEYQGLQALLVGLAVTAALLLLLRKIWVLGKPRDDWRLSMAWHFGLFFWFCFLAFPWLGEVCC